jgi:hypothetical protein
MKSCVLSVVHLELESTLDHLIQRRFFGPPGLVVDFVCSRRGRNRLAHDRFLLLFWKRAAPRQLQE